MTSLSAPTATARGRHRPSTSPPPPPAKGACAVVRHAGSGQWRCFDRKRLAADVFSLVLFVTLCVVRAGRRPRFIVVVSICGSS